MFPKVLPVRFGRPEFGTTFIRLSPVRKSGCGAGSGRDQWQPTTRYTMLIRAIEPVHFAYYEIHVHLG